MDTRQRIVQATSAVFRCTVCLWLVKFFKRTLAAFRQLLKMSSPPSSPRMQPSNPDDIVPTATLATVDEQRTSIGHEQMLEYVRKNVTVNELVKLLGSMRPQPPEDRVAEQIMKRTAAIEQLSVAHEFVYGLGRKAIKECVLQNLKCPDLARSIESARKYLEKRLRKQSDQRQIIFPPGDGTVPIDVEKIDITLWVILAEQITRAEGRGNWIQHVYQLRKARNHLAHSTQSLGTLMAFNIDDFLLETGASTALEALGVDSDEMKTVREKKVVSSFLKFNPEELIIHESDPTGEYGEVRLMPRVGWKAEQPGYAPNSLKAPLENVVITHTVQAQSTLTTVCCHSVRTLQFSDINARHFADICVNYLIGNDGVVYEGRGAEYEASFARGWNRTSLGFAFIGTYDDVTLPSDGALNVLQSFLKYLVARRTLRPDYKLYALRQIRPFPDAPGKRLFEELKTWQHWTSYDKPIPSH